MAEEDAENEKEKKKEEKQKSKSSSKKEGDKSEEEEEKLSKEDQAKLRRFLDDDVEFKGLEKTAIAVLNKEKSKSMKVKKIAKMIS